MQSLEQFDPTASKLTELLKETAHIIEVNLDDPEQLATVKRGRINLRNARVSIEKTGKAYRADALAYQKAVIAKEKELIAIIEPEEDRLASFEKEAADLQEKRLREQQLPERRARLEGLGLAPLSDEVLLTMTSLQFETNVNQLVAEKNDADRAKAERLQREKDAELAKREAEIKAKEDALAEEERAKEREEKARQDERDRIEREATEKKQREEREAKEAEEKRIAEEEALKKKEEWLAFIADLGYTEETKEEYKFDNRNDDVVVWKRVAIYKKN